MAIYTRGVPVRVIVDGDEELLTRELLAEDVLALAGGPDAVRGPPGEQGETGPQGPQGDVGPAGPGVPAGGVAGQVLGKSSSTDYATAWTTPVVPVAHVAHGTNPRATRTRAQLVIWIGSVEPLLRIAGDIWIRTS